MKIYHTSPTPRHSLMLVGKSSPGLAEQAPTYPKTNKVVLLEISWVRPSAGLQIEATEARESAPCSPLAAVGSARRKMLRCHQDSFRKWRTKAIVRC